MKCLQAADVFRRAAPARDLEAEPRQRIRHIPPDHAKPHHADRNLAGGWLIVGAPKFLALLGVVEPLPPVVHQHVHHDIAGDALRQIVVGDASERHRRQRRIRQQMIDAGAQIDDRLEIGKSRQQAMRRIPDAGV